VPHLIVSIEPDGASLTAYIGVSKARRETLQELGQDVPDPVKVRAMIDTGASCTCIVPKIAERLGLTPSGQTEMYSATSEDKPVDQDEYDVGFLVVNPTTGLTTHAFQNVPLVMHTIKVVCTPALVNLGYEALIGRDILAGCMFVYDGRNGKLLLSY
jgi:hypothetical protein